MEYSVIPFEDWGNFEPPIGGGGGNFEPSIGGGGGSFWQFFCVDEVWFFYDNFRFLY